jgi:ornithine carbamoyltransferase
MARVMSRYVDGMVVRTFGQQVVNELATYSSVPVINALTDLHHPCQVLSDVMTIIEKKGPIDGMKVAWVGDGNNMANSWIQAASRLGFELTMACPQGYEPDAAILKEAQGQAVRPITLLRDPKAAVIQADVINVDVWASMGKEQETSTRLEAFNGYQINAELLADAPADCIVLHCLPAHRGEEITDEVLESKQCVAFDQAENKMHMHKAILEKLIGKK